MTDPTDLKHPLIRSIAQVANELPDARDLERLKILAAILQRHSCGVTKAVQEIEKLAQKWEDRAA